MEIINEKYAYIDEATNAIASINNKINISLLLEDLTKSKSHKNNKKRIMLKKKSVILHVLWNIFKICQKIMNKSIIKII